jgi:hypothetical protein
MTGEVVAVREVPARILIDALTILFVNTRLLRCGFRIAED